MLISSQRYLDDDTVAEKSAAQDFVVTVYQLTDDLVVVIDGHHSLEAARESGVKPTLAPARGELKRQLDGELEHVGLEQWLENHFNDSPWYDVATGRDVW